MIELFKSLLNAQAGGGSARKTTPTATTKTANNVRDFRAVSLSPCLERCDATKNWASKRHLWRDAPQLPLPGCVMRSSCSCKFVKHTDRRDGERRLLGGNTTKQWFVGSERRQHRARRAA